MYLAGTSRRKVKAPAFADMLASSVGSMITAASVVQPRRSRPNALTRCLHRSHRQPRCDQPNQRVGGPLHQPATVWVAYELSREGVPVAEALRSS